MSNVVFMATSEMTASHLLYRLPIKQRLSLLLVSAINLLLYKIFCDVTEKQSTVVMDVKSTVFTCKVDHFNIGVNSCYFLDCFKLGLGMLSL